MAMAPYWFDANIFIECKNRGYAFDIAPGFWDWVANMAKDGIIRSPKMVFDEISGGKDQLANWLRMMKKNDLFVTADSSVQKFQSRVFDYVVDKYESDRARFFLKGADPWIIAHAGQCNGIVVTHEAPGHGFRGKVQIPDVCKQFGVQYSDLHSVSRKLGLKLVLKA